MYICATGWTIGVLGFYSRLGLEIFLFTTASRLALGPTQPPIQWVPGAVSLGVKWPGREADHSPPSSADVKEWLELYLYSPDTPSWRGARFKKAHENFTFLLFTFINNCVCRCVYCHETTIGPELGTGLNTWHILIKYDIFLQYDWTVWLRRPNFVGWRWLHMDSSLHSRTET
jgi:hypothetical protein